MVINRQRRVPLSLPRLREFSERLGRRLRLSPERFAVVLVSDRRMAALERRYRGRRGPTDVLSFPAGNGNRGDVVISVDTAVRNARRYGHSLGQELKLLMVHGLLHLLGYDHETDQGEMDRREHVLRRGLGLE